MHLVLLEKDWMEAESIVAALTRRFPNYTIHDYRNFGDFLIGFDELYTGTTPTVIITEDRLALMEARVDFDAWRKHLTETFPGVITSEWDRTCVPQALLKHFIFKGIWIPIILYTHSQRKWIDSVILANPLITHLEKEVSFQPLTALVAETFKSFQF